MKIFLLSSFDPDKFINKFELPQDPTTYLHMYLHIIYEHLDIFWNMYIIQTWLKAVIRL